MNEEKRYIENRKAVYNIMLFYNIYHAGRHSSASFYANGMERELKKPYIQCQTTTIDMTHTHTQIK